MKGPREILAVEMQEKAMAVVLLPRGGIGRKVQRYALFPRQGFDNEEELLRLRHALQAFVAKAGVAPQAVTLVIPRKEVLLSFLHLPYGVRDNLAQVVRFEVEKHVPYASDQVYYAVQVLRMDPLKGIELLLVAAERQVVDRYVHWLAEARLGPHQVDVSTLGFLNALSIARPSGSQERLFCLRGDNGWVELNLLQGGDLVQSRLCAFEQGGDPALGLRKEMELLHTLSGEGGEMDGHYEYAVAMDPELPLQDLPADVGAAALPMPAQPWRPLGEAFRAYNPPVGMAAVVGAAQHGHGRGKYGVNLLPQLPQAKPRRRRLVTGLGVLVILAALGMGMLSSSYYSERRLLKKVRHQIRRMTPEVEEVEAMRARLTRYQEELDAFASLRQAAVSKLAVVRELTLLFPATAWVTQVLIVGDQVEISGYAQSASTLISILENSSWFKNAQFVAPITQKQFGEEFRIRVFIERGTP